MAGADRIRLSEQIGVEDLVSLGDFLTLPEDDLALAEVLKSPLFNLDDDDLLALANGRKGTLWKALLDNAGAKPRYAEAAATLKRWRKAADFTPPYEFFAALLDRDGVRKKLLSRLGPDAADPLDEFLNLALTYDDNAPPSLTGFLAAMRAGTREIKRDMEHGRNEVRVMTVHGAKGLEAPIVFLPDTCSAGSAARQAGRPMKLARLERPSAMPDPVRLAGEGHKQARGDQRRQIGAGRRGAQGTQPPSLRRHDARPRPPLRRRLRGQEGPRPRLLVRADLAGPRRRSRARRASRRASGAASFRCADCRAREAAPRARRRSRCRRDARLDACAGPARARADDAARALALGTLRDRRHRRAITCAAPAERDRRAGGSLAGRSRRRQPFPARHADPRPPRASAAP